MQNSLRTRLGLAVVAMVACAALLSQPVLGAGPAAKITDLSWMTGSYEGSMGGNGTLEENWAEAKGGSIASLVRSTTADATTMIELIVIEETEGSLVLRLQQWNPGWVARTEGPQVMNLVSSEPNKVVFEDASGGALKSLSYSLDGDTFTVSVATAGGNFDIPLKKK